MIIGIIGALFLFTFFILSDSNASSTTNVAPLPVMPRAAETSGYQQPPGEAPPGKVWSPEHGHWHDIQ